MKHAMNAARDLGTEGWHKPWSGSNNGNCVEAKNLTVDTWRSGSRQTRRARLSSGPPLRFPPSLGRPRPEWRTSLSLETAARKNIVQPQITETLESRRCSIGGSK